MVLKKKNKLKKKIFIKTFGCQMNEYDSNRITDLTKKIGYIKTNNLKETNCYVLNTCHIREKATEKMYHEVGRIKKEFSNKKKPIIIITGCVAQAEGEIILKKEKYVDAVIGPQSYHKINEIIKNIEEKNNKFNETDFKTIEKFDELNKYKNSNNKISSYLTIQEGCDKFCKFCVVPYTRGPEYSRSFSEILNEAKDLVSNGVKEIILLGQNVNAYRNDSKKLADLIYSLDKIEGLKRIRYTTSHPKDMTKDLIQAHGDCKKLMPYLHLPLQSGSNKILKEMNRKHTIDEYLNTIELLKNINPQIKLSSDFIIAYPRETKNDFDKSLEILNKVKFINSFSFIYSPRPGTPASLKSEINYSEAKKRLMIFQSEADKIKIDYKSSLVNKTTKVLVENKSKDRRYYFGRDEFNNSVIIKSEKDLIGKIQNINITNFNQNTLFGAIPEDKKNAA
tara:strand:- start:2453 stop:3802 length:1350 start_codon:yes stop_codon:yes gene_type:complete